MSHTGKRNPFWGNMDLYRNISVGIMIVGVVIVILGVTGAIDWNVEFIGIKSNLVNASPGIVIFIFGGMTFIYIIKKTKVVKTITKGPKGEIIKKMEYGQIKHNAKQEKEE